MPLWNYYFLGKFALALAGKLKWDASANILLLSLTLLIKFSLAPYPYLRRAIRWSVVVPAALALAYQEFDLPPITRLFEQFESIQNFSPAYLGELIGRFIPLRIIAVGILLLPVVRLSDRIMRLSSVIALIVVLALPLQSLSRWLATAPWRAFASADLAVKPTTVRDGDLAAEQVALGRDGAQMVESLRQQQLDGITAGDDGNTAQANNLQPAAVLQTFYKQQQKLQIPAAIPIAPPDFDIIVLHICSLSWDDLKQSGLTQHPLLRNMDVVFERFNTGTSYSGPAAIRLLRAYCGQSTNANLYNNSPGSCHLFAQLAAQGYQVQLEMNHDGQFEKFIDTVKQNLSAPSETWVDFSTIKSGLVSFDGTPLADDGELLKSWWQARINATATRTAPVALYYNTVSLHDGNRYPGTTETSIQNYPKRAGKLFSDINKLIAQIAQSKRRALVLLVPEHGAALAGDTSQISGLRDTPTPAITIVPAAARWVDGSIPEPPAGRPAPVTVSHNVSYTALATLLNKVMENQPNPRTAPDWKNLVRDLPVTRGVSENDQTIVMQVGDRYKIKLPAGQWSDLP